MLADRRKRAQAIIARPEGFALCEGCESITVRGRNFCPVCLGYRWNYDRVRIVQQAELSSSRPQQIQTPRWDL
jgi:hypothetical protein